MRRPRLNSLRVFEAAGRRLNFSAAAAELNISQAAVSQQIRQLEAYLNAALFIRQHRQMSLTSAGKTYLIAVHEALDRLDSITDQLFPDTSTKTVTLRCTSSLATLWLAPQLGSFQKSHPDIELHIRTLDQDYAGNSLIDAELEIVISSEGDSDPDLCALLRSIITPVCAPALLPDQSTLSVPADVLALPLIHVVGYEDDWHRWFRHFHLQDVNVPRGLSVDSSLIAIEATQRGDGVMLGRRPFINHHLQSGELVEAFAEPYHLHTDYYLRHCVTGEKQQSIQHVKTWLLGLAAEATTTGE